MPQDSLKHDRRTRLHALVRALIDRKQQRKPQFDGRMPFYYNSIPAYMAQQGTPLEVAYRVEAYLASLGRHRASQQGRSVGLCSPVSTDGLTSVCRQRLRSTQVFGHRSVVVGDLTFGYSAEECSHRAQIHVVFRISRRLQNLVKKPVASCIGSFNRRMDRAR
jgi:hypothetical protein